MSIRHFNVLALQQKLCQFVCFAKNAAKVILLCQIDTLLIVRYSLKMSTFVTALFDNK